MSRRFTAIPVLAILILSTLLLLGAGGCYSLPGGGLFAGSNSPFTYISTAEYPKTFVLVNTKTGENIFEMDIPVDAVWWSSSCRVRAMNLPRLLI